MAAAPAAPPDPTTAPGLPSRCLSPAASEEEEAAAAPQPRYPARRSRRRRRRSSRRPCEGRADGVESRAEPSRGGGASAEPPPPLPLLPPLPGRPWRGGGGGGGEHVFCEDSDCRLLHGQPAAGAGYLPIPPHPAACQEGAGGSSLRSDPGR